MSCFCSLSFDPKPSEFGQVELGVQGNLMHWNDGKFRDKNLSITQVARQIFHESLINTYTFYKSNTLSEEGGAAYVDMEGMVLLKAAGKQLGKWMVEEAKHLHAVKDKVEGLQSELEWIQCFLRNADEKHGDDELVQKWISEVNDFSYEAEDILEKYLLKVSNPRKEDGIWSLIKWATCALGDAISTHEVGWEIDALSNKISKLAKRMKTYGVTPVSSSSLSLDEMRFIHPHHPVDDIVGLEDDTNVLINQLMNRETKVIAISGMPGSGKTTLARKVYLTVKGHQFKMCAWVYISLEFQPRSVILGILLSLYADDKTERNLIQNMGTDDLEKKLYDVLKEKKCLVVLDDLWEASDWNRLKNAFSIKASSSKLMITTRNTALLSSVDPRGFPHQPKGLSFEDSWKLFRRKAFLDMKDICTRDPGMKDLGSKMIKRCNGLPLAIAVLGGLLAPKKTLKEWERVNKTFLLDNNNVVTKVLELSYTSLPYHLKPCFLHLGNFPEDSEIPTKKLYRMWIAEGIVAPRNDKPTETLEDTANSYLQELVHRCIVQVGKIGPAGRIRTCRLHDLMRHMCVKKAKEKNFLSIASHEGIDVGCSSSVIRDGNLHRLAVHFDQISLPSQSDKTSHLRSLMFFGSGPNYKGDHQGWLKEMISDFKLLRILDLENTGIEEVPRVIGNLIHLRYLSIMGTQVTALPSTLRNLRCLQTLDLRVSLQQNCVLTIPNVLWRMKELNYLYLPSHAYKVKRFQKLRVKGLSKLKILKNFDTTRSQVNNLHKLENLRKLCIKNEVSKIETLKIILECQSIRNHNLLHLSLKIHGSILNVDAAILSSCNCLHTLELYGTNPTITELMLESFKFPESLTSLAIINCSLICTDPMQNFKNLHNLRSLSLDNVSFSGDCMNWTHEGFSQLVDLKLSNMDTLKEWKVGVGTMPNLYRLRIYDCDNLQRIPDGLPTSVRVVCKPCKNGINKYLTCPHFPVELVDDDDADLATRLLGKSSPLKVRPV